MMTAFSTIRTEILSSFADDNYERIWSYPDCSVGPIGDSLRERACSVANGRQLCFTDKPSVQGSRHVHGPSNIPRVRVACPTLKAICQVFRCRL